MSEFTPGNLVVYRVGAGSASLTSAATPVFLDEYAPDGTLVQSIALPTADAGQVHALTESGTATSEGMMTLSSDGHYLVFTGYDVASGTANANHALTRTIARVGADGTIDTTTTFTDDSGENARGVASADGSSFYVTSSAAGVRYEALGGTSASADITSTVSNVRGVEIFDGQLYLSTSSGSTIRIGAVGTGEPTTTGQTTTNLPGLSSSDGSPYAFFFAHLDSTNPGTGPDTLYVADDGSSANGGGVSKYTLSGGTWTKVGTVDAGGVTRGITGSVDGSTVTLYVVDNGGGAAAGGGVIKSIVDTSGFGGTIVATPTTLVTAPTDEAFRGIAFAPTPLVGGDTTAPTLATASPVANATGVDVAANIVLAFSEAVKVGTGHITLIDTTDNSRNVTIDVTDTSQVTISGSTVTINPTADLHTGDNYQLSIDATAITDLADNAYAGGATVTTFGTAAGSGGTIPSGSQSTTFTIGTAGTWVLAAGQTFTETGGSKNAIAATVSGAAQTTVDIEGTLIGSTGNRGVVATLANGQVTIGAAGLINTTDGDGVQDKAPNGGAVNLTNLGQVISQTTITSVTVGGSAPHGYALNWQGAAGTGSAGDYTSGGTITNGSSTNTTALLESKSSDAIRLGTNQTVTNYGRIAGSGPVNDASSNNPLVGGSDDQKYDASRGIEINGFSHVKVDNFGLIEGAQHGIDAGDAADSDIIVINEVGGVITGHNGSGVGADAADATITNVQVTNSGTITGASAPTFDRSGAASIDGDGDGVDVDGGATIVNNHGGTIQGTGASGFDSNGRANHSEGVSIGGGSIDNHGLISGADYGVTVNNDANADRSGVASTTITNETDGVITGVAGYAIRLENRTSDGIDTDTITNHGTINGGGTIPDPTGTATIQGGGVDQNTVGALDGVTYTAGQAGDARFVSGDGAAVQMGEGADHLINDGTINGAATGRAISMEGGDDVVTLYAEGQVSGTINGGAGADTLELDAHTGTSTRSLAGVLNIETLHVKAGVWTISDAEAYASGTTIDAGATLVEGTGSTQGAITGAIVDSGVLAINHSDAVDLGANVTGSGALKVMGSGTTTLSTGHSFSGVTIAAGVLDIAAHTGAGTGAITFANGPNATLKIETAASAGGLANLIKGFATGDTIDVAGVGPHAHATLGANNVLTVTGDSGTVALQLDSAQDFSAYVFNAAADGTGGAAITLGSRPPIVFTSGAAASIAEGVAISTAVYTAAAGNGGSTISYSLSGADAGLFNLDAATGALTFKAQPNFDQPADQGANNVYDVIVTASDGLVPDNVTKAVAITVTDSASVTTAPTTVAMNATVSVGDANSTVILGDIANQGELDYSQATSATLAGSISGSGDLEKTGAGTLTLSGVSTYSGETTVDGGVLAVDGSIANSSVTVGSGATVQGHGAIGALTVDAGGTVSPGNSPGTLTINGDLTLTAGATYKEEIGGVTSGHFDVAMVTGAVNLAGATLNASLYGGFSPTTASSPLVIINNDGSDAVTGTFAGLAEGATVSLGGGATAKISYAGGDGNDVTLTIIAPAASGPAQAPSVAAGLTTEFANLLRATATSADATNPESPIYAQLQAANAIAAKLDAGTISLADAQTSIYHLVDGTVSVAQLAYEFFTGKTPTADGLNYLVHSSANATDLDDAYYAQFNTENRYINFAAGLGSGQGAGAAAFQAAYGQLSLTDAAAKAYAAVFGVTPAAGKIDAILNDLVSNGRGGTETRAQYLADITGGSALAQKAAVVGFFLADSMKEAIGPYQSAELHYLADLGHGTAQYNVDLLAAYGSQVSMVGQPAADMTLPH